jgi:hypothetical protein
MRVARKSRQASDNKTRAAAVDARQLYHFLIRFASAGFVRPAGFDFCLFCETIARLA